MHGLISIGDVTRWYIPFAATASRFRSSGREADGYEQSSTLTLWLPVCSEFYKNLYNRARFDKTQSCNVFGLYSAR